METITFSPLKKMSTKKEQIKITTNGWGYWRCTKCGKRVSKEFGAPPGFGCSAGPGSYAAHKWVSE